MIQNCLISNAALVRDVTQLADYVIATTPFRLDTGFEMEFSDVSGKFMCVNSSCDDRDYTNIFYSEEQIKTMYSTFDPVYYRGDVKGLLRYLGIDSDIKYQTSNTDWLLSAGSIRTLISTLNQYASVQGGGCPFFSIDLKGRVRCVDLKYEYDNASSDSLSNHLPYRLQSDLTSTDWMHVTPTVMNIVEQSLDDKPVIETVNNGDIGLHARTVMCDNTGFSLDNLKVRVSNEYNQMYYRSRVGVFSDTVNMCCRLGEVINITDQIFVVDKVYMPIALADGRIEAASVRAVAPYVNKY